MPLLECRCFRLAHTGTLYRGITTTVLCLLNSLRSLDASFSDFVRGLLAVVQEETRKVSRTLTSQVPHIGQMIDFLLHHLDLAGQIYFLTCMIWLMLPGGSRMICMIWDTFPKLDLVRYSSCTASQNGRLGSR